jgi:hypothetical protein
MGTALLLLGGLLLVGAILQGVRRGRAGDWKPVLIVGAIGAAILVVWLAAVVVAPHMN